MRGSGVRISYSPPQGIFPNKNLIHIENKSQSPMDTADFVSEKLVELLRSGNAEMDL